MIEIEAPDGTIVEFPEGTLVAEIEAAMSAQFGGPRGSAGAAPEPVQAVDVPESQVPQFDYVPGVTVPPGETDAAGLMGAVTRGTAAPLAGATIGAALGAPIAGVGAVPGAMAGLGAGALTEIVGDPIVSGINRLFGTNFTEPTVALQNLLTSIGVPEADSEAERIVQKVATGAAGGIGGVGIGRVVQSMAGPARPLAQRIGAVLAEQPAAQVAGGAGAGLAAGLVPEDAGPLAEAGAALVGGVAGGAAGAGMSARRAAAGAAPEAMGGRASVGAAGMSEEALRRERAEQFGIDILPPQASRNFADQQRMRELAKNNEVGGPIREGLERQQDQLRQRFERFVEGTGSEQWNNPYAQGGVIADALGTLAKRERTRIKALYTRAENAGELREPVAYQPILDYIAQQTPTTLDSAAPVLKSVREQLALNDPQNTGSITLQQMEDIRQLINRDTSPGTPNAFYGRQAKEIIDDVTENSGGDVYKRARAARKKYASEFENVSLINDLIGMKPGDVDRRVALERVVNHITRPQTSLDSVNHFKGLIDRAGPRGQRAMRELQGAVLENIRDAAYKGITRDQGGGVVIQPATLNNTLRQLDRGGKLEVIFDKPTAQMLRDINLLVMDLATAPPGALNPAGTSSAILNALDLMSTLPGVGGLAAKGLNKVRETAVRQELKQEVSRLVKGTS